MTEQSEYEEETKESEEVGSSQLVLQDYMYKIT